MQVIFIMTVLKDQAVRLVVWSPIFLIHVILQASSAVSYHL